MADVRRKDEIAGSVSTADANATLIASYDCPKKSSITYHLTFQCRLSGNTTGAFWNKSGKVLRHTGNSVLGTMQEESKEVDGGGSPVAATPTVRLNGDNHTVEWCVTGVGTNALD